MRKTILITSAIMAASISLWWLTMPDGPADMTLKGEEFAPEGIPRTPERGRIVTELNISYPTTTPSDRERIRAELLGQ